MGFRTSPGAPGAALACVCLAAAILGIVVAAAGATASGDGLRTMLTQINLVRAQRGLRPLAPDVRLMQAAQRESEVLAGLGILTHVGPDGDLGTRVRRFGYRYRLVEENLAAGIADPASVVNAWLRSPLHRANLLRAGISSIGIGYAPQRRGILGPYWTLILAEPAI
ncbi:MAG: CAP domain-containing protein [Rhodospirillaceae bacterium]|nr:CAP domain-containing protein [Rhodospirillaceae bacterium]